MEGSELLEREARFRQLNKELEKRTQTLFHHIETAMQKQDSFADISNIKFGDNRQSKPHSCKSSQKPTETIENPPADTAKLAKSKNERHGQKTSFKNTRKLERARSEEVRGEECCCLNSGGESKGDSDWTFLEAFISVNVQDNVLPKSFLKESSSAESVCKFLASKLKLMQEQIDKLQDVIDKKAAQCELHMRAQASLEAERLQLAHRAENLRAQTQRHALRVQSLEKQLQAHTETERRYAECRSEKERLCAELKKLKAAAAARSVPLEESLARLKSQLAAAVAANKEYRESARSHAASQRERIGALERQRRALELSVHKLTSLTDNLRRQNALLDSGVMLKALEVEYARLLDHDA